MNKVAATEIKAGMTFKQHNAIYVAKSDAQPHGNNGKEVVIDAHCPEFTIRRRSNGNRIEKHGGYDQKVYFRSSTMVALR
jgi:hypothetical protein